jgi:hypothetical protein
MCRLIQSRGLLALCVVAAVASVPFSAQERGRSLADLALVPEIGVITEPPLRCGTALVWAIERRLATAEALADGEALFFDQTPRILRPDYGGDLRFTNFLVVGDVGTVTFERVAPETESGFVTETWERTGTRAIDGRVVSVFNPSWSNSVWDTLVRMRVLENSHPLEFWGHFHVSGAAVVGDGEAEPVRRAVYVNTRVGYIPSSTVTEIDPTVQYASHVVNLVIPGAGESRVQGGQTALNLSEPARKFFEHFQDAYDSIAFVSQSLHVGTFGGFHLNVKNEITGLGREMPIFDNSTDYGSAGVLKGIEFYPYNTFGANDTSNHEAGHQWEDYWNWSALAGGIVLQGHDPTGHTPLIHPGEVLTGAVLEHDRRVAEQAAAVPTAHGPTFVIERSPTPQTYHPLALYRMGLIPATEVPTLQIFEEQGQFDPENSTSPDIGRALTGEHREVHINGIQGREGQRFGPVQRDWRRATVVISRDGLLSRDEMDYWNFYAARHAAAAGVRAWDGNPSFREAARNLATMTTDITPKTASKINETPTVAYANLLPTEWRGVQLDEAIPGRVRVGQRVNLAGRVTATDRTDFTQAAFRFRRYAAANANEIFFGATISGNRFRLDVTFTDAQKGAYLVDVFLFWPDSDAQFPRTSLGVIYVD